MLKKMQIERAFNLIKRSIKKTDLNLRGHTIATECASGAYACSPIISLMAGADRVLAYGRDSRFGNYEMAHKDVIAIAERCGIELSKLFLTNSMDELLYHFHEVDIIMNSGHLRPIDSDKLKLIRKKAVVSLNYDSWKFRKTDIDFAYCKENLIDVIGINEQNENIKLYDYYGAMVIKVLLDSGLEVYNNDILLISDNKFGNFIQKHLSSFGANVFPVEIDKDYSHIDAIVFAHTPKGIGGTIDLNKYNLPLNVPVCCQIYGDVEREYFNTIWFPEKSPPINHMGILLSVLGFEPVILQQSAGLKASVDFLNGNSQSDYISFLGE